MSTGGRVGTVVQRASRLAIIALLLAGCSTTKQDGPAESVEMAALDAGPVDVVVADQPWTYYGIAGRLVETPSYRIFMTERDPLVSARIPVFLELALAHYRTLLGDLPAPRGAMETYILASRNQWAALTRQLMGRNAEVYLKIRAGGFASDGRAMLFNIGSRGTFATTSHEGWHQYTQRAFRQPLPIWLEEGIATLMEGYRWDEINPARPIFLPWANVDRFSRLRELVVAGRAFPLEDLLDQRPQDLLNVVDNERALDYYAQVWALAHFLREGESGRYRAGLEALAADALAGTLYGNVRANSSLLEFRELRERRAGPAAFRVYFNDDLNEASDQYDAFLSRITETGARDHVAAGSSPLR